MSLQEADFDHRQFQQPQAGDERLFVQFYNSVVQDQEATKKEGRPIFKDCEWIRIQQPGNLLTTIERPVRPQDKARFPRQYQMFKVDAEAMQIEGTPLAEWPLITRAQVEEMKFFKILTVEHLAELSDAVCQKMMGVQSLKAKAKDWLATAKGTKGQKDIKALREQNEAQALQIQKLMADVADLSAQLRTPKRG